MKESNGNAPPDFSGVGYLESLYAQYREDPSSLPPDWGAVFGDEEPSSFVNHEEVRREITRKARWNLTPAQSRGMEGEPPDMDVSWMAKQAAVLRMIQAYRILGHVRANTDPIDLRVQPNVRDLDPRSLGLGEADMDVEFNTGNLMAPDYMKLRDILSMLRQTYTGSIGFEYMFISDADQKDWLMRRIEETRAREKLSEGERKTLLSHLVSAEGLERYMHIKFSGKKRFSLEGGESFIPLEIGRAHV